MIISPVIIDQSCENRTVLNQQTSIIPDYSSFYSTSEGFMSLDPRTFDTTRNMYMLYDRPPLYSSQTAPQMNMDQIKTNQTGFYNDYQSIRGGDIRYYTSLDTDDPYSDCYIPCYNRPELLVDPMGSIKPYYIRIPVFETNPLKENSLFEYSFLRDTSEFREDLTARQQQKYNTRNFGSFQLANNPSVYYPTFRNQSNYPLQTSSSSPSMEKRTDDGRSQYCSFQS